MFKWIRKNGRTLPSSREVMARLIILKYLYAKGLALQRVIAEGNGGLSSAAWKQFFEEERKKNTELMEQLHRSGLWKLMENNEHEFMGATSSDVTRQALINVSWSIESIACFLWALGYIPELPPYDQQTESGISNRLPTEPAQPLMKHAALRPYEMIQEQRAVAELWHWRSRTRKLQEAKHEFKLPEGWTIEKVIQVASTTAAADGVIPTTIGDDFPAWGKAYRDLTEEEYSHATSIAMERHRAFNWLCGHAPGNHWAETPTDT